MSNSQVQYSTQTDNLQDAKGGKMEEFYTMREVSERMSVHINTVKRWIRIGWLKAHKVGGRVRIYESDLHEFLNRWN